MTPKIFDIDKDKYIILDHFNDSEILYAMTKEEYGRVKSLCKRFGFNYQNVPAGNLAKVLPLKEESKSEYKLNKDSLTEEVEINTLHETTIWQGKPL